MRRSHDPTRFSNHVPPQSLPASASSQFTFVDQSEDLQAVATKRLKNEKQRHQIRSHVMRGVRQHELALGKKRPTGREIPRPPIKCSSPETSFPKPPSTITTASSSSGRRTSVTSITTIGSLLCTTPSKNGFLDPFNTSPAYTLSEEAIDGLLKHCFTLFFPEKYPMENKQVNERLARQAIVLQSRIAQSATFFGFMSMAAAHRAVMFSLHDDLGHPADHTRELIKDKDYQCAKSDLWTATQNKVKRGEVWDADFVEACFSIISIASFVGNFAEATTHLRGVQKIMEQISLPESATAWLPISDVETAVGLLSRPTVPPVRDCNSLPQDVLYRVLPRSKSAMKCLGTAFHTVHNLTSALRNLIPAAVLVCNMCEQNSREPDGLNPSEQHLFRLKVHELEYDLLSYVFDVFPHQDEKPDTLVIPPIEQIVRLAILGMMSKIAHYIPSTSGLGRAYTYHQKTALDRWLKTSPRPDVADMKVVAWALFNFIINAEDQTEAHVFKRHFSNLLKKVWLLKSEEVEATIYNFLYVPRVQKVYFMDIWEHINDSKL